jgi:hypothetical protein
MIKEIHTDITNTYYQLDVNYRSGNMDDNVSENSIIEKPREIFASAEFDCATSVNGSFGYCQKVPEIFKENMP